jgi:hypothetical protein
VCDFFLTIFQFMKDFDKAISETERIDQTSSSHSLNPEDVGVLTRRGSLKEGLQRVRNAVEPSENK